MAVRTTFTPGEVLTAADLTDTFGAKGDLASPTFTGTPAGPTASAGTDTTQLATTAFVLANRGPKNVVSATKTDTFSTVSTSFVDVTGVTVTITPSSATSKILIFSSLSFGAGGGVDITARLMRGATEIGSGAGATNNAFLIAQVPSENLLITAANEFFDSPSTTSATTYKIQMKVNSGTGFVNRRGVDTFYGLSSTITAIEVFA